MAKWNLNNLHPIMEDFYTLTHIRVGILDENFSCVLTYPQEADVFCALIRKNKKINKACLESEKFGCAMCAKTGELATYICPQGLNETVIPIIVDGSIEGYILFGHILFADRCPGVFDELRERFPDSKYPGASEAMKSITIKTEKEIHAIQTLIRALPEYVLKNRGIVANKRDFLRELKAFINSHISERITSTMICEYFSIGKTHLYKLSSLYLDCSLSEYIRNVRVEYAKNLLESSDLPISEIADKSGFSDYSSFSRCFKQITGCSARDFRRESVE